MSSIADLKVEKNVWINATSAAGASPGDDLLVQNIGNHTMRVEAAVNQPTGDTVGAVVRSGKQVEAITELTESVWLFGRRNSTTVNIQVIVP